MCRIAVRSMKAQKRGAIVNIGSASATYLPSYPLYAVYAATKVSERSTAHHDAHRSLAPNHSCSPFVSMIPLHGNAGHACPARHLDSPAALVFQKCRQNSGTDITAIFRAKKVTIHMTGEGRAVAPFRVPAAPGVCGRADEGSGGGTGAVRRDRGEPGALLRGDEDVQDPAPAPGRAVAQGLGSGWHPADRVSRACGRCPWLCTALTIVPAAAVKLRGRCDRWS